MLRHIENIKLNSRIGKGVMLDWIPLFDLCVYFLTDLFEEVKIIKLQGYTFWWSEFLLINNLFPKDY